MENILGCSGWLVAFLLCWSLCAYLHFHNCSDCLFECYYALQLLGCSGGCQGVAMMLWVVARVLLGHSGWLLSYSV